MKKGIFIALGGALIAAVYMLSKKAKATYEDFTRLQISIGKIGRPEFRGTHLTLPLELALANPTNVSFDVRALDLQLYTELMLVTHDGKETMLFAGTPALDNTKIVPQQTTFIPVNLQTNLLNTAVSLIFGGLKGTNRIRLKISPRILNKNFDPIVNDIPLGI